MLADPLAAALNVASAKARAVAAAESLSDDDVVLAADTLVVDAGRILGKPTDGDDARQMLTGLRGRVHQVLTGIALMARGERSWGGVVSTNVEMRTYADDEVEAYIARGEPFDKAGGYAIQDADFRPVTRVAGCYLNVVGLPVCAAAAGLHALGASVAGEADTRPPCAWCTAGQPLVAIRSAQ